MKKTLTCSSLADQIDGLVLMSISFMKSGNLAAAKEQLAKIYQITQEIRLVESEGEANE